MGLVFLTAGFKTAGRGENRPTVQSAFGGAYCVRSVPSGDYGDAGKTQVFRVKGNQDELLDEYPVFMRGELYLGWSPLAGEWCLVHVEPERIASNDDYRKLGKVSRLAFYMGGVKLHSYSGEDLGKMGLNRKVQTLVHRQPGQFLVRGIRQVPRTNEYVFVIETTGKPGSDSQKIQLDITTGQALKN